MWNRNKAIVYLEENAKNMSVGRCAEFVRKAIEAGGVILIRQNSAKDYGSSLDRTGFRSMGEVVGDFQTGDVVVIQPIKAHPSGHMAMYNGKIWISDFRQNHGLYPGPSYRQVKPAYIIYRHQLSISAQSRDPQFATGVI